MRLFASVDCSELGDEVAAVQERFADLPGVRITDPETVHVTLAFLGDVSADRLVTVERAMAVGVDRADVSPFDARIGGFGVFPDFEYITVVWLGVREGATAIERLHHGLVGALTDADVSVDVEEEFVPHVTIARVDHAGAKERLQTAVREGDPDVGTLHVDHVELVESRRSDAGPTYETVGVWEL